MPFAIESSVVKDSYPLTPMQSAMLFHSLYSPQSGTYIEQVIGDLVEAVDESLLERSWQLVLERHAVLRTSFRMDEAEGPIQRACRRVALPIASEDWTGLPPVEQEARFDVLLETDRRREFDLASAPLMRVSLIRLAREQFRLLWTFHHALLDGRSERIVLRDLFDIYDCLVAGEEFRRAPPPRPYRDYVTWLLQQDLGESERFWKKTLKGVTSTPSVVECPPQLVGGQHQGPAIVETRLSQQATARLQSVAEEHGLTMNTMLQGAWAQLLSRYCGAEDIVFGATRALRGPALDGIREMVGLFINTIPMRVSVPADMPLLTWLKSLRSQWVSQRPFERAPLADILQWSGSTADVPLFSTLLVFENSLLGTAMSRDLRNPANRQFKSRSWTHYPLTVVGFAEPELTLKIAYEPARFDEATLRRMLGHLRTLLERIPYDLDKPLKRRDMLTKPERRQILDEWQDTKREFAAAEFVHRQFEAQARRSPAATAVACDGHDLTYEDLNLRSNQLAHHLQRAGVGANSLVGIFLPRSPEVVVAMVATFKAGGAYLLLDKECPQQRLDSMLQDARLSHIVTVDALSPRVADSGAQITCLDGHQEQIAREKLANPHSDSCAEHVAYAVFTSGSTGHPKGILVPHRALTNHSLAMIEHFGISASDRRLQLAPLSSDVVIADIFPYLLTGGTVVIRPNLEVYSVADLLECLEEEKITVVGMPSALWHEWVLHMEQMDIPFPSSLRLVIAGMDRVRPELLATWKTKVNCRIRWFNAYGPSEATCTSTTYEADYANDEPLASVPIGRPIANTKVYLLDAHQNPVPIGVPGEIYIGGCGVACGYLDNATLTAERFIANPFTAEEQDRIYKTGDLARYRDDGNIEFLGRTDHQVKLRGYRIELGEIERVLSTSADVRDCVVELREDRPDDKRLVAYVVSSSGEVPVVGELRRQLGEKLPAYMIPVALVHLESLPRNANGKVDRSALPPPEYSAVELGRPFVPPRTLLEETLSAIWADVLGVERVGVHDDFFALGGHSLRAAQATARSARIADVELPVRVIFEYPTLAEFAARVAGLRESRNDARMSPTPAIIPRDRSPIGDLVPLSFAQRQLWFLAQLDPNLVAYNMQNSWRLNGPLDVEILRQALESIVARHEPLRTVFGTQNGEPFQLVQPPGRFEIAKYDLSGLADTDQAAEVARLAEEEFARPFDLTQDVLLRAALVRLAEQQHVLLMAQHHIASDGWSLQIFWRELELHYAAYRRGAPCPLEPLKLKYTDYAVWQRERLQGEFRQQLCGYWSRQLADLATLELPTDRDRPAWPSYQGARYTFHLDEEPVRCLRQLSSATGVTLQMTLLATFQLLLARHCRQTDIVVGVPSAGRLVPELEPLIGFFVNTLVLRTDLSGSPTFEQLLHRVRETSLAAYDHQELPFEMLVEVIQPKRHAGRNPLFQVMFQWLPLTQVPASLDDVEAVRMSFDTQPVRFDLEMHFLDDGRTVRGELLYSTDLFDAATIDRLMNSYRTLLDAVAGSDDVAVE